MHMPPELARRRRRALGFAARTHEAVNQRRKYTGEPYIVHPVEVAEIVLSVTDDPCMVEAAILHDTVEDSRGLVVVGTIACHFGDRTARYVDGLTDVSKPSDGNRAKRKAIDRAHSAAQPADVQTIKVADLISNTCSITEFDPNFARVYLREKVALLEVLRKADPRLRGIAERMAFENMRRLGI